MATQRYALAEGALWQQAGLTPVEHRIHLSRNDVDVRLREVGDGPPVLFLHGGPGAAGPIWADLAARLPHLRCLLLDRPGTGLSARHLLSDAAAVRREAETMVVDVLDALELDRAHLVGSSHGSYIALLSSAAQPHRVDRTVHLGCPGFVEGMSTLLFDRLVLLPGAPQLFGRLPASEKSMRNTFRQLGHGASLAADRIPQALLDWCVALQRDTDTMRNELASMGNMGTFRGGFDPRLTVQTELLHDVRSPTYVLWGANDPYGDEAVAQRLVDALPDAELELLPDAGHLCWLDDLDHAATVIDSHLLG